MSTASTGNGIEADYADAIRLLQDKHAADLDAVNAELDSFSYSVSHDLRAPIRAILGYSRAVLDDYGAALDDEGQRLLAVVQDEASRMGKMLDELLAISRLGRQPMNYGPVDMMRLAQVAADEQTVAAGQPQTIVDLTDLSIVHGDETLLAQVWTIVLGNAIKYSSKQPIPHVQVWSTVDAGHIVYHVRDNGVGFDMKYADKLFGVFQKLHRTADFVGAGVGLAKVKRIVHRHGGTVWAEARPGEGATFSFALPTESEQ